MAKYTVRDTTTGKRITFNWYLDTPPTEKDLDEIFKEAEKISSPPPPTPLLGVPEISTEPSPKLAWTPSSPPAPPSPEPVFRAPKPEELAKWDVMTPEEKRIESEIRWKTFEKQISDLGERIATEPIGGKTEAEKIKNRQDFVIGRAPQLAFAFEMPVFSVLLEGIQQLKNIAISTKTHQKYDPLATRSLTEILPENTPSSIKIAASLAEMVGDTALAGTIANLTARGLRTASIELLGKKLTKKGYDKKSVDFLKNFLYSLSPYVPATPETEAERLVKVARAKITPPTVAREVPPALPPVATEIKAIDIKSALTPKLTSLGYTDSQIARMLPETAKTIVDRSIPAVNASILPSGELRVIKKPSPTPKPSEITPTEIPEELKPIRSEWEIQQPKIIKARQILKRQGLSDAVINRYSMGVENITNVSPQKVIEKLSKDAKERAITILSTPEGKYALEKPTNPKAYRIQSELFRAGIIRLEPLGENEVVVVATEEAKKLPASLFKPEIKPEVPPEVEVKPPEPTKEIPKELEPLAEEARKYKSAEEFAQRAIFNIKMSDFGWKLNDNLINILKNKDIVKSFVKNFGGGKQGFINFYNLVTKGTKEVKPEVVTLPKYIKVYELPSPIGTTKTIGTVLLNHKIRIANLYKGLNPDDVKIKKVGDKHYFYVPETAVKKTEISPEVEPTPPEVTPPPEVPPLPPEKGEVTPEKPPTASEQMGKESPVDKVIKALKEAKALRSKQERIYTEERAKRIAQAKTVTTRGERGYYEELAKLKGEMLKVQFESIRDKLTQEDIDELFNMVKDSNLLTDWEKISARRGLAKLFGEFGGVVPTESELELLKKVFPTEFIKSVMELRPFLDQLKKAGYEIINVPRALITSCDFSAPLRQGIFVLPSHPIQFSIAFGNMFKYFLSEKHLKGLMEKIRQDDTYDLMVKYKLGLTDIESPIITEKEEKFMSNLAERIPGAGLLIRASDRAYTGFLNHLRWSLWRSFYKNAEILGLNPRKNPELLRDSASFINSATGRGDLPDALKSSHALLNGLLFSPRLVASRVNLLNPVYYASLHPYVRKEALKSLLAFIGSGLAVLSLLEIAFKDKIKIGKDIRSADFGKIIVGNTRIDPWGGFQQYVRLMGQLITGQYISTTTGIPMTLGEGYRPLTRFDILLRFFEYKEAPIASFVSDLLKGQTVVGEDINIKKEIVNRVTPMVIQDFIDIAQDNPDLLPIGILGIFGIGIQTYTLSYTEKEKKLAEALKKSGVPEDRIRQLIVMRRTEHQYQNQLRIIHSDPKLTPQEKIDKIRKLNDLYRITIHMLLEKK